MTAPRLLPVQRNYLDGMEHLLDIYYLLKSLGKDRWFSDDVIKMVAKLFTLTISNFSRSIFYGDGVFYHLRYGSKDTAIMFSESDFSKFLKIFNDFYTEVVNGKIEESYRVIRSTASVDFLPIENKQLKKIGQDLYSPIKKVSSVFECKIYRQKDPWYVKGKFNSKMYDRIHADLDQLAGLQEVFHVDIDVGSPLIYSLSSIDPIAASDHDDVIVSPPPSKETSFCDAIRYVMAKFYTVFGSFNRIKVCLNEDCKKLIVEKKSGAKLFCDMTCRMEYNANHQPLQMRLCRERQNQWLRNQLIRKDILLKDERTDEEIAPLIPDHVNKANCDACKQIMKSGLCPVLRSRNFRAMRTIDKLPKRSRIINKVR